MSEAPKGDDTETPTRIDPIDDEAVELYTSVGVDGLSSRQQYRVRVMAELVEANFETFVEKNRDYGSSFEQTGRLEAMMESGPFDDSMEASLYHLWMRVSDKHHRLHQQLTTDGDSSIDESALDTALDAANYYLLIALLLHEKQ